MIRFSIYFSDPANIDDFENAYNDFLALIEHMPYLQRRQIGHVIGSPQGEALYFRSMELYFNTQQELRESLMSSAGQEAGNELARFGADNVHLFFSEIYEESGGSTPQPEPSKSPEASSEDAESST